MNINSLTLLLTDKCNYKCNYCYQWRTSKQDIDPLDAKKILKYVLNNSSSEIKITFSGGEPLLKFDLIKKCIFYLKKNAEPKNKKLDFSIITNGSLINNEILAFLIENKFSVQFSFDVYLKHDPIEFNKYRSGTIVLKKLIKTENISLSTNTVFTPERSLYIFDSVRVLYYEGVKKIGISIDQTSDWNEDALNIFKSELDKVKDLVIKEYLKTGNILIDLFSLDESSNIKMCGAVGDDITISPDGELWGCPSFYYYDWENVIEDKEKYYYGRVDELLNRKSEKKFGSVRSNYNDFRTDNFSTEKLKCFLCEYILDCLICPAQKYSYINWKRSIFHIPEQICKMNKIIFDSNKEFKRKLTTSKQD